MNTLQVFGTQVIIQYQCFIKIYGTKGSWFIFVATRVVKSQMTLSVSPDAAGYAFKYLDSTNVVFQSRKFTEGKYFCENFRRGIASTLMTLAHQLLVAYWIVLAARRKSGTYWWHKYTSSP